jgi:hypothetical protein
MKNVNSIDELKKELVTTQRSIERTVTGIEATKSRLVKAEERRIDMPGLIEECRKARQETLAKDEDHEEISLKLRSLQEEAELLEDTITACNVVLGELDQQKESLEKKLLQERRAIYKEDIIRPLVDRYNDLGSQMATTLTSIEEAAWEFNSIEPNGSPAFLFSHLPLECPDGALSAIPTLYMDGSEPPLLYDRRVVIGELRQKFIEARHKRNAETRLAREKEVAEVEGVLDDIGGLIVKNMGIRPEDDGLLFAIEGR